MAAELVANGYADTVDHLGLSRLSGLSAVSVFEVPFSAAGETRTLLEPLSTPVPALLDHPPMAAAPNQHKWQIAATKGAETMTRTRLLWAGLVAATTTPSWSPHPPS